MARSILYKSMNHYVYTRSHTFSVSRWLMYCSYTQEAVPTCQLDSAPTAACCSYIQGAWGATSTYQLVHTQGVILHANQCYSRSEITPSVAVCMQCHFDWLFALIVWQLWLGTLCSNSSHFAMLRKAYHYAPIMVYYAQSKPCHMMCHIAPKKLVQPYQHLLKGSFQFRSDILHSIKTVQRLVIIEFTNS